MDLAAVKNLRRALTLHFAIIAWLTAMLVATGSGSIFLPVFIFFVSCVAYLFVDTLEWFEVGRIGSYIGMLVATAISIGNYVYSAFYVPSESGQLMAIAGLLVYPEAVLFLQRKNLRIFEQLAIFLLLEMIVAALVNDNVLFGLLLAPIMLLWVSSLFLFSRYATLVQISPSIETPLPKLAEIIFRRFVKSVIGENRPAKVASAELNLGNVQFTRSLRRTLQSVPIGIGAIAFAGFFFYLLPRTTPASLQPTIGYETRIGLPKSLAIGTIGRLLADPTPVMRVKLTDAASGEPYPLNEPPYLRARVMDTYGSANRSNWTTYGEWVFQGIFNFVRLKDINAPHINPLYVREPVQVEFDVRRRYAETLLNIPPAFQIKGIDDYTLKYDAFNMVLEEPAAANIPGGKSVVYSLGSTGFSQGNQIRAIPAPYEPSDFLRNRNLFNLTRGFTTFTKTDAYRRNLLAEAGLPEDQPFAVARLFEQHLLSDRFSYTLDLRPPNDTTIDPIEDFLLNQRRGHCQYFASAMVVMLRQSRIPSRIIVGYRPTEFNKYGRYFLVKQSDAHAWVEALMRREDLVGTELERWLTDAEMYWVRFDPTPGSDDNQGGIVEQQGQAIDYAEKLWKDYVVEGQKLGEQSNVYAPVSENSKNAYDQIVEAFQNLKENIEDGRLFRGNSVFGFAWPLTILIIAIGLLPVLLWRVLILLPKIAPRLAGRLGLGRDSMLIKQAFFARCVDLLEQHGLRRSADETPQEFTSRAARELEAGHTPSGQLGDSLGLLTTIYYRLRFGSPQSLTAAEQASIEQAIRQLEAVGK